MNKSFLLPAAVVGATLVAFSFGQMGMGGMSRGMMGSGPLDGVSMVRHRYYMSHDLDPAYAWARNPLPASPENLKAGKAALSQDDIWKIVLYLQTL